MQISLRPFAMQDLPQYERWQEEIHASQYMTRFYPHAFNEEGSTFSDLYRWYIILANGEQVGTVWLEKGYLNDEVATLGILIGVRDHLGKGIGGLKR
jgi:RimJ/RimL family protein N-acetyltransferase